MPSGPTSAADTLRQVGAAVRPPVIAANLAAIVGGTPLVRLGRIGPEGGADLLGKLEVYNPAGSVKDRIGVAMIEAAEAEGRIEPGRTTIVEATSGNTGIALAFVCAAKGYELMLAMPQGMSRERESLLRLYGAEVQITESHGRDGRGGGGGVADRAGARRRRVPARPVLEPGQPRCPSAYDRRGDLARHRRGGGRAGGGSGHGRHHHRGRRAPQGAQAGPPRGRGRTGRLGRDLGSSPGAAPDPGHRRRLRAGGPEPRGDRRADHSLGRRRHRHRARCARPRACSPGSRAGRRSTPRSRSQTGTSGAGGRSSQCMPDSGERYVSTPFFAP